MNREPESYALPRPKTYRARLSYLYGLLAILFTVGMCAAQVTKHGAGALLTDCWIWYLVGYAGLFFLLFPHARLERDTLKIVNPLATYRIGYEAMTEAGSNFQLELSTEKPDGSGRIYKVFGVPAGGMTGSERHKNKMADMGTAVYRGPSLYTAQVHGLAAEVVAHLSKYRQERAASPQSRGGCTLEERRYNPVKIGILLVLLILTIIF